LAYTILPGKIDIVQNMRSQASNVLARENHTIVTKILHSFFINPFLQNYKNMAQITYA